MPGGSRVPFRFLSVSFWIPSRSESRGILACRDDGQWPVALALLAESEQQQVRPDAPMLNAVIGVCGYGREWQKSLEIFADFSTRRRR